ncbi:MAG: GNAT family N-acetyltransferase [Candidatus Heimdallarchaeaceae archaeon]
MKIRTANQNDGKDIAKVKIASWRTTYTNILPSEILDNLSLENQAKIWTKIVKECNENKERKLLVAENEDGEIIGFAVGGKPIEQGFNYDSEIGAIYLLKEYQKKGIGSALVKELVEWFKTKDYNNMVIWVLKENSACEFYQKIGGIPKEQMTKEIGEDEYLLVGYVWDSLDKVKV